MKFHFFLVGDTRVKSTPLTRGSVLKEQNEKADFALRWLTVQVLLNKLATGLPAHTGLVATKPEDEG